MPETDTEATEDKGVFMETPDKEGDREASSKEEDKGVFMAAPEGQEGDGPPKNETDEEKAARAFKMGIHGDPDLPHGYMVDPNHRPNPLDVGTMITTEHGGGSGYDVAGMSGLFSNAGIHPSELEENIPPSPEPPPPMGATDYMADPTAVATEEEEPAEDKGVFMEVPEPTPEEMYPAREQLVATPVTEYHPDPANAGVSEGSEEDKAAETKEKLHKAHAETIARLQAEKAEKEGSDSKLEGDSKPEEDPKSEDDSKSEDSGSDVQDKAEKTVEAAEETVEAAKAVPTPHTPPAKAQGASKASGGTTKKAAAPTAPTPPGTKDSALETPPAS